jgi:hypothetical protein
VVVVVVEEVYVTTNFAAALLLYGVGAVTRWQLLEAPLGDVLLNSKWTSLPCSPPHLT